MGYEAATDRGFPRHLKTVRFGSSRPYQGMGRDTIAERLWVCANQSIVTLPMVSEVAFNPGDDSAYSRGRHRVVRPMGDANFKNVHLDAVKVGAFAWQ